MKLNNPSLVVRIGGRRYTSIVAEIVEEALGFPHSFYAAYSVKTGIAKTAILWKNSTVIGAEVFYETRLGDTRICVHYYLAVRRKYRGHGYGKILVTSVEEVCSLSDYFIATTTADNDVSIKMFISLGYKPYTLEELERLMGWEAAYELIKATCGFEDDIFLLKPPILDRGVFRGESIENIWRRLCLEPWLKLRYYNHLILEKRDK